MRRFLPLLLFSLNAVANPLFFGKDNRIQVQNQAQFPWSAIGLLTMKSGIECSATLVRSDRVLTAAHCFFMEKKDKAQYFYAGRKGEAYAAKYQVVGRPMLNRRFAKGLTYKNGGVYIAPKVASFDYALIKVKKVSGIAPKPLPVFRGGKAALKRSLRQNHWRVTQAGYASDKDNLLMAHKGCKITQLNKNLTLSHQCDTLSGDSGSPIWLMVNHQPRLIAVQSSAPDAKNRNKADNIAVSVLNLPKGNR
jgi:protease YdgD